MKTLKALFFHKGTGRGNSPRIPAIGPNGDLDTGPLDEPDIAPTFDLLNTYEYVPSKSQLKEICSSEELAPCDICGRTFLPASLLKHSQICQKTATKKRKAFDSSRQRREGTDLAQYLPKNFGLPEHSPFLEKEKERTPPVIPKMSVKVKQPSPRNVHSKLLAATESCQCPHCGRGFGARAFDRHVAWCAARTKLAAAPGCSGSPEEVRIARSRLMARTSYRAPPVKSRRSMTREKYSLSRSASVESGVSERSSIGESHQSTLDAFDSQHLPIIKKTTRNTQPYSPKNLNKPRFDDNYDPFLSAKRQMMNLMSSNTNLTKLESPSNDYKKELSPFPVSPKPYFSPSPPKIQNVNSYSNNTLSPYFNRQNSLRNTANSKYSYKGKITPSPYKAMMHPNTKSDRSVSKNDPRKTNTRNSNVSPKSRNSNASTDKSISPNRNNDSLSRFPNRTEKHRVIKLEPVENIANKKHDLNSNSLLTSAVKNNLSSSQESFIDPRLINDKIPLSVQKLLDNSELRSSSESFASEHAPVIFDSFTDDAKITSNNFDKDSRDQNFNYDNDESTTPTIDDLSAQYDKIMVSLEQSMTTSQFSTQDEDSLYNDLEELMSSFDEQSSPNNRFGKNTYRATTKNSLDGLDFRKRNDKSATILNNKTNRANVFNKSISLNFSSSSNNALRDSVSPVRVTRSNSSYTPQPNDDNSIPKKVINNHYKEDESKLEDDIMRSLKDIDKLCALKTSAHSQFDRVSKSPPKETSKKYSYKLSAHNKNSERYKLNDIKCDGNAQPSRDRAPSRETSPDNYSNKSGSKSVSDSAYGSLNRSSPSGQTVLRAASPHKSYSISPTPRSPISPLYEEKKMSRSPQRERNSPSPTRDRDLDSLRLWSERRLSSSGSDASLPSMMLPMSRTCSSIMSAATRASKFCHECGCKFPMDSAKFCIECGVRRLIM